LADRRLHRRTLRHVRAEAQDPLFRSDALLPEFFDCSRQLRLVSGDQAEIPTAADKLNRNGQADAARPTRDHGMPQRRCRSERWLGVLMRETFDFVRDGARSALVRPPGGESTPTSKRGRPFGRPHIA